MQTEWRRDLGGFMVKAPNAQRHSLLGRCKGILLAGSTNYI